MALIYKYREGDYDVGVEGMMIYERFQGLEIKEVQLNTGFKVGYAIRRESNLYIFAQTASKHFFPCEALSFNDLMDQMNNNNLKPYRGNATILPVHHRVPPIGRLTGEY